MELPKEMIERYIERRKKDYLDCVKAIEEKNLEILMRVGHQMKGNAEPYGFAELAVIGEKLETASEIPDWEKIKTCVNDFGSYLQNLQ